MIIPFVGGAYTARSTNLNAQTCINLYPVIDNQEAKNVTALFGTPGLTLFTSPESGTGLAVRAMHSVKTATLGWHLYVVIRANVYKVNALGVATLLGTLSTTSGFVSFDDNGAQVIIVDGTTEGRIITVATDTLASITDADFPAATSVTFQDGYFVVTEKGTGKFFISALYDGTSWNALDFATAEGRPDNGVIVKSNTHDLWIFGEKSVEVFWNSGNADFPFERISGAIIDTGIGAIASLVKIDGVLYWITDKGRVCRSQGYQQQQYISTPHIDFAISSYTTFSDAISYTYRLDDHIFLVYAFPTAGKTWVYDVTTNYWHEWQSYHSMLTPWGRHRSNCSCLFNGQWLVGDYTSGSIYILDPTVYTDNLNTIRRERTTPVINKEKLQVIYHSLDIDFEAGVGLDGSVQGSDPQAVLDWSDDGGHTWSNQHWSSVGKIGEYGYRAQWRRLGKSRGRNFRLVISDPVKVMISGAYGNLEECKA